MRKGGGKRNETTRCRRGSLGWRARRVSRPGGGVHLPQRTGGSAPCSSLLLLCGTSLRTRRIPGARGGSSPFFSEIPPFGTIFPFLFLPFPFQPSFPPPVSPCFQGEDLRRARPPSLIRPRCTDDDLFEPTSIFTSVHWRHTKHTFGRAWTRSDRRRNDMATVTRMSARQGTGRGNQTARLAKRCVPKDPRHETGGRKEPGTE